MTGDGKVEIGTYEEVDPRDPSQKYFIDNGCRYRVYISRHHGWQYFVSALIAQRAARKPLLELGALEPVDPQDPAQRYYWENGCRFRAYNQEGWQYCCSETVARWQSVRAVQREAARKDPRGALAEKLGTMPASWREDEERARGLLLAAVQGISESVARLEEASALAHPGLEALYDSIMHLRSSLHSVSDDPAFQRTREAFAESFPV